MDLSSLFLGPLGVTFFLGITTLILLLWNSYRKHKYWEERGVPFVKPYPLAGSILEDILHLQHELDVKRHKELGPVYGTFEGNAPTITIADPELLKLITVKDFQFFGNRRTMKTGDIIMDNILFNLSGEDWKRVRTIVTPTFTTGKLKRMMGIFKECCKTLVENLRKESEGGKPVNVKKYCGTMSMDVIVSSAFSTKIDSANDPDNPFVSNSRKVFEPNFTWRSLFFIVFPKLFRLLKLSLFPPDVRQFFKSTTMQIIKERKRLGHARNDFLQLLIDTEKERGQKENMEENEGEADLINNYGEIASSKVYANSVTKSLSMDELIAQCVLFFISGYESTGATLAFMCYNLALNPDVQEKARHVIRECLLDTKGEITYEAIQKMKYLDNIISESLRLFSVSTRTERVAEADYKLGNTGIMIEKGMVVTIPLYAMHRDPQHFPEPDKFDPDRFSPEEREKRNPYAYMPFGAGPRNCVAMRFALLEIKMCLAYVISFFNINTCSKTNIPPKFKRKFSMLQCHDIYLELEARRDSLITL